MDDEQQLWHGSTGAFSSFICGVAIIVSYLTPSQRRFPNIVLTYIWYGKMDDIYFIFDYCFNSHFRSISDFMYATYIAMKWLPGPLNESLNQPAGSPLCYFSVSSSCFLF